MGVEPTHFDVAIVGGGLAGLTLSIQLAKQGRKVILLEKEAYPYHKVCGEYIAMESWEYLERCNIPLSTLNLPRIRTLQLSSPNGNFLTHTLNPGGFGISRFTLDYLLAIEAKKMGVVLLEHCKVDEVLFKDGQFCLESKAGNFTADFAFGAYGKRSNLDLKQKRKFALTKQTGANNYHEHKRLLPQTVMTNEYRFEKVREKVNLLKKNYCLSAISEIDTCLKNVRLGSNPKLELVKLFYKFKQNVK